MLKVREDRYAGLSGPGSFRGSPFRGGGGYCCRCLRGGYRGVFAPSVPAQDLSNQGLYTDYSGPDQPAAHGGLRMDGYGSGYGSSGYGVAGSGGAGGYDAEPSQQIMVRNLPWSTTNEDLVEELAEILFDGARSKGCGVVQFAQVQEAEIAIAKFSACMVDALSTCGSTTDSTQLHLLLPRAAR
ncbi:hypothetical protein BDR07DRAFT_1484114 [Suillus spraguei]|nr:hypothetical protein BDR07DRAFT_1484114 [Suillus spraguei]